MQNAHLTLAALAATATAIFIYAVPAGAATSTTQKTCSGQYQAAKSAGTLNGQKWPAFYSDCATNLKSGAATTTAALPAPAPMMRHAAAKAVPAGHQTTQQICSTQYQAAKSAGTLNGQKWPAFLSSCSDSIKGYSDQAQMGPPEPRTTAQVQPVTSRNATLPASGKTGLKSAGEVAFQQRIHECANEWKSEKSAGTLPAGSKWPQFWGQCNTQLKAQM